MLLYAALAGMRLDPQLLSGARRAVSGGRSQRRARWQGASGAALIPRRLHSAVSHI